MNRLLTRKKDRGTDDGSSGKKSKKWKKAQPEPKLELNVAAALPSADDFRTSLIMPTLSTRFSMLREQDDPNSKLGKASDDSVLHPKRQSRLHEFGFIKGGLADIAEVSSIHDAPRPPFANERQNSFDSHSTEEGSGSIMNRTRPGEGNVLFGGRQKIYKIPNSGSSKSLGRVLYDDDVSLSTFQKFRLHEKHEAAKGLLEQGNEESLVAPDDTQNSEPSSPSRDTAYTSSLSGYNQRRETSSSTNSGTVNTRSSTAATSIASQGANSISASSPALPSSAIPTSPTVDVHRTKTRRLYDHSLDQHINEQQSSALNRLNSLQRNIAPTGRSTPPLMFSQQRSATNLSDRFNRRNDSPNGMGNTRDNQSSGSSPAFSSVPQSPTLVSPIGSDGEDAQTLQSALQPNDRGKATALGAFNKPKMAFSEQQYAERLRQLHQDREAATPKLGKPGKPSLRERVELEQRKRAETLVPNHSQQDPTEESQAPSPFSVFQKAVSQMKTTGPSHASPLQHSEQPAHNAQSPYERGTTFFSSAGDSSDEEADPKNEAIKPIDLEQRLKNLPLAKPASNRQAPSIFEHPALRSRSTSRPDPPTLETTPPPMPQTPGHSGMDDAAKHGNDPDIDSPTLGPTNGGLSGLVRQHLRNVSTVSSDYGETSSPLPSVPAPLSIRTRELGSQQRQPPSAADRTTYSSYSHSNPWDLEDGDNSGYGEADSLTSNSPIETHKPKPHTANGKPVVPSSHQFDRSGSNDMSALGLKKGHHREGSTETQDEREAFQKELAQRQRAIQESLRSKVSGENSRSASPAPSGNGLKSALTMLRSKSSRDSFATVDNQKFHDAAPKAMRMLGLGSGSANASTTSLSGPATPFNGDQSKPEEERQGPRGAIRPKPSRVLEQSEQDARRELEQRLQRSTGDDGSREVRPPNGRSPPTSSKSSTRNRSSSELSNGAGGRSNSHPARYRDDLEKAMTEGTGSSSSAYPTNSTPSVPGFVANPTPPLSEELIPKNDQGRLRSRSNSRTNGTGYFEQKTHLQIHTGHGPFNGNARLSPAANSPKPSFSPGLPASPRPSPGAPSPNPNSFRPQPSPLPPFSASSTPPISGATTPVVPSFGANTSMLTKSGTRKKSIAKSDISEPVFISGTSVMDTVDLPPGASLKNGMDAPPPVPPINPLRRRFGFGRNEQQEVPVQAPLAEPTRTNSSDEANGKPALRQKLRKTSSEGRSLHAKAQLPSSTSQALPSGALGARNNSPPRPLRPSMTEGGMF